MKSVIIAGLVLLGIGPAQAMLVDEFYLNMFGAAGGTGTNSNVMLAAGVNYEVQVSGTFQIGCLSQFLDCPADAEYYIPENGSNAGMAFNLASFDQPGATDVGVQLDNVKVDWGIFNPAHTYSTIFTGTGSTLFVSYLDTNYGDNRNEADQPDGLNVKIFTSSVSPSAVPVPAALPLFLSGLLAVGWLRRRATVRAG